jgi:hypothetical protein
MKLAYCLLAVSVLLSSSTRALADDARPLAPLAAPPAPLPAEPLPTHRSPGMMVTGIALTGVGASMLLAGVSLSLAGAGSADSGGGNLVAFTAVPLIAGSLVFAAVGIPLWVVGGRSPRGAMPAIAVGAGATTLRWTF